MAKVSVIGAGTFGTAVSWMLNKAGHEVLMWCYEKADSDYINARHYNPLFLTNIDLAGVSATSDLKVAAEHAEAVIFVTPSFAVRSTAAGLAENLDKDVPVCLLSKGLDYSSGNLLIDALKQELGNKERLAVLSGPNHAEEIALGIYAGTVIASWNIETAKFFQELLSTETFRVYTSDDPTGVSLCGAAKNPIAIACGIARGLGFGDNTQALLMTRGLAEMTRLVRVCGGKQETCVGLAGAGDVFVTCASKHSRNGSYGEAFAATGISYQDYEAQQKMVVEGAHAVEPILRVAAEKGIEMPITKVVSDLINGVESLEEAIPELVQRSLKNELY